MLIKFIARGTGSAAVADALEFEQKYTSAVIAWAPEDQPSDKEIDRVLDEFEDTAWPGLAPDRYAWTAVRHRAAGAAFTCMLWRRGVTWRRARA